MTVEFSLLDCFPKPHCS